MADVKAYKPETNSTGSGQVLQCPYDYAKARLIVQEMTDLLVLDLVDKGLVTDQVVLTVGYDIENLTRPDDTSNKYKGAVTTDHYGRRVPKHAHGTVNLNRPDFFHKTDHGRGHGSVRQDRRSGAAGPQDLH